VSYLCRVGWPVPSSHNMSWPENYNSRRGGGTVQLLLLFGKRPCKETVVADGAWMPASEKPEKTDGDGGPGSPDSREGEGWWLSEL
jgi:hypothetical protein